MTTLTFLHSTEHIFKSSAYLADTLLDPTSTNSFAAEKTAFNKAFNTDVAFWNWIEQPGNEHHLKLFAFAMDGMTHFFVRNALPGGTSLYHFFR